MRRELFIPPVCPVRGILLLNAQPALAECCLENNREPGEDKFRGVYPHIDWSVQLEYAEELNLGSRVYDLTYV